MVSIATHIYNLNDKKIIRVINFFAQRFATKTIANNKYFSYEAPCVF